MKLKAIVRNLIRSRLHSSVIIISLAIGIACTNLIAIFISREYNADGFQKNKNRIYALQADDPFNKGERMYFIRFGAAEYMKNNFPEVQDFCRISNTNPIKITIGKQDFFNDSKVIVASSNFFDFFSYRLLINTPKHVLVNDQDIVISEDLALKYFGASNPVGQKITLVNRNDQHEMFVSGVFKTPEESTQLNFNMVRLIGEIDSQCYLLLNENADINQLESKFARNKALIPIVHDGKPGTHHLKSMSDAYFDTTREQTIEIGRNKSDLKIALVIALMILSVALFNYIGLINNRLVEKTREHAIRRINGGSKINLIGNLMSETSILIAVAFFLSIFFMIWAMPFFNHLTSSTITISYIFNIKNTVLLLGIPVLILFTSFLFISARIAKGVQIQALKPGRFQTVGSVHIPVFNIAQLAISVVLIIGSILIMKQINYITHKEIGLNKEVLEIKIPQQHKNLSGIFKAELEKHPSIEVVSLAEASPVLEHYMLLLKYDDNGTEKQYTPSVFVGDQNYTKTLGVKIIAGEDFAENRESNIHKCIINESLAKLFPDQNLIGKELPGDREMFVIGVAKDFHYGSLKEFIEPGYIAYGNKGFYLMVKPAPGKTTQTREIISKTWDQLITDFPLNMESIGDRYEWMHRENANYAKLVGACCFISIFLSMIGLFAISFHTSRRRTKEIGIRKVNGAKVVEVLALLNKDFFKWVSIAFIIACPVAWLAMHKWLQNFAYKTEMSWWVFATAGAVVVAVALLTVSWQSWRAATRNPVEALRYE